MRERPGVRHAEPLFWTIDQFPRQRRNPKKDTGLESRAPVELVVTADSMLARFGVHPQLVSEIGKAAKALQPLGSLVLGRKPTREEANSLEGRGAYHTNIPVPVTEGSQQATVYVKGIGSKDIFEKENSATTPYPGFPRSTKHVFFDAIEATATPRTYGAMTMPECLIEMINASTIFAFQAKKHGWKTLQEAIDAGVTIPLSVQKLPALSEHFSQLYGKVFDETKDERVQARLLADYNLAGHGTVSLLVPSNKRMFDSTGANKKVHAVQNWKDSEATSGLAETVKSLYETGFVYVDSSSRIHNIYDKGAMRQADNVDLLFLDDVSLFETNIKDAEQIRLMQQSYLLYEQLSKKAMLTPPIGLHLPMGYSLPVMLEAQQNYWQTLLGEKVQPERIRTLALLMPYMRTEIMAALSHQLIDISDQAQWKELGAVRAELIDEQREYAVGKVNWYEITKAANRAKSLSFFDSFSNSELAVTAVQSYLQNGDKKAFTENKVVSAFSDLAQAIQSIDDPERQTMIHNKTVQLLLKREIEALALKPDVIAAFDYRHIELLNGYIKGKNLVAAESMIDSLDMLMTDGFRDRQTFLRTSETVEMEFGRKLMLEEPEDVFQMVRYLFKMHGFFQKATRDKELADMFFHTAAGYHSQRQAVELFAQLITKYEALDQMKEKQDKRGIIANYRQAQLPDIFFTDNKMIFGTAHFGYLAQLMDGVDQSLADKYKGHRNGWLQVVNKDYVRVQRNTVKKSDEELIEMYKNDSLPLAARALEIVHSGQADADYWDTKAA